MEEQAVVDTLLPSFQPLIDYKNQKFLGYPRSTYPYSQPSGLTLTEILIVLAIVTLLASAGLPTYFNQISKYRLHGATRRVMSDLFIVRKQALSQKRMIQVLFDGPQHYRIWRDINNDGKADPGEMTTRDLGSYHVRLEANNNPRFHPSGTVTNLSTIVIKHPAVSEPSTRCITISIAGRIKQGRCRPAS